MTGPTGPAIATPAIDTPRQAVNNARFKIDCFIDILSFLYYFYTFCCNYKSTILVKY